MQTPDTVARTKAERARSRPLMERAHARDRQFTAGVLSAAVLVTGTLLLLHRPSAEVLVDTKSSTVSFTVTAPFAPLRGVVQVAFVELAGLAEVREEGAPEIAAPPGDDLRLRVEPDTSSKNPGAIGFDSLLVPGGHKSISPRPAPRTASNCESNIPRVPPPHSTSTSPAMWSSASKTGAERASLRPYGLRLFPQVTRKWWSSSARRR